MKDKIRKIIDKYEGKYRYTAGGSTGPAHNLLKNEGINELYELFERRHNIWINNVSIELDKKDEELDNLHEINKNRICHIADLELHIHDRDKEIAKLKQQQDEYFLSSSKEISEIKSQAEQLKLYGDMAYRNWQDCRKKLLFYEGIEKGE